jgi:aminopeptidase C
LDSIQTDKAILFYADRTPSANWFVEQVLPGTSESKDATENLKLVAAAL